MGTWLSVTCIRPNFRALHWPNMPRSGPTKRWNMMPGNVPGQASVITQRWSGRTRVRSVAGSSPVRCQMSKAAAVEQTFWCAATTRRATVRRADQAIYQIIALQSKLLLKIAFEPTVEPEAPTVAIPITFSNPKTFSLCSKSYKWEYKFAGNWWEYGF